MATAGNGHGETRREPSRGAVAGFGRMGLTHFAILNSHPDVRFVGVCDSSSFMRRNVRKHLGVQAYADYREMLDAQRPDFLIVATPTAAHADIAAYALERGAHVFVEKPFTLTSGQGARVAELAARAGRVGQVGYVVRYNDVMMQVHALLRAGAIGAPVHFKVEMYGPTVLREPKSWRARRSQGGGCLYDFASHAIDLACYLVGAPESVAGTAMRSIYSRGVEDAVFTTFRYADGLTGTVLANWSDPAYRKPTYRVEILGRGGKIVADLHAFKIFFHDAQPLEGFNPGWNTRYVTDFAEPVRFYLRGFEFTRQLDEFVARIRGGGGASRCTFEDGLATDRVLGQIVEDAGRSAA